MTVLTVRISPDIKTIQSEHRLKAWTDRVTSLPRTRHEESHSVCICHSSLAHTTQKCLKALKLINKQLGYRSVPHERFAFEASIHQGWERWLMERCCATYWLLCLIAQWIQVGTFTAGLYMLASLNVWFQLNENPFSSSGSLSLPLVLVLNRGDRNYIKIQHHFLGVLH